MSDIDRLDVYVGSAPEPGLIRSRIEAVLARRPCEPGPEHAIGQAIADAVSTVRNGVKPSTGKGAPG